MTPWLVLTACAASGLRVCAQEVVPPSILSSARRSTRPTDQPQPAGQPNARETRSRNHLALPQAHAPGLRCCACMIRDLTSGGRPILLASSRALELLRTSRPDHGPHVLITSRAAQAMRAYAERCRAHPRSGSAVRCSGTDFAEFSRPPQSFPEVNRHGFEVRGSYANFLSAWNYFFSV